MIWRVGEQILAGDNGSFVLIGARGEVSSRYESATHGYDDGWLHIE